VKKINELENFFGEKRKSLVAHYYVLKSKSYGMHISQRSKEKV